MADEKEESESNVDNRDPLTDAPGSHPIGTGIGSAGGAAAEAANPTTEGGAPSSKAEEPPPPGKTSILGL